MDIINEIVTNIDYYVSIAKVARLYNYVKPIIKNKKNSNGYLSAKEIRHPIVERIIEHEYVPHNIELGLDLKGMLIYGLNSAGKSVLMKSIGMSIVLAQAGFYVPARKFTYYPYKALYTRITGNDNLLRGLSSYGVEMVELNSILKRSNESTLVIGDEVCRGTEYISGNAIVASTVLKLSDIGSTFVFATHLHELVEIDDIKERDDIKAFHLTVEHDVKNDKLIYDRELKPGSGERIYGITVAKYIIKDADFIEKALTIKNKLLNRDTKSPVISTKTSRYNSKLLIDKCGMCGKRGLDSKQTNLETHHINHQKDCDNNGFVKNKPHIKKNAMYNLLVLCNTCHDKIHTDNISGSIKMTSSGQQIIIQNTR
jgi:DNA mismatch repair protein MutS